MTLLKSLNEGHGYLKAGFLGFQKSGKTYTATELAIGTRKFFDLEGPIAFFDTEGGSTYVAKRVKQETGKDLVGHRSRALSDLIQMTRECIEAGVSVLVADSMTHVWREVCDSYLAQVNEARRERAKQQGWIKRFKPRTRLEFQDWAPIKATWHRWADLYLNAPLHIIICGRAGWEYDFEEDEDSGKKELIKTGTKMKTETEFGFEPSLLVEMEQIKRGKEIQYVATVLGDRFDVINGKSKNKPTWEFFKPFLSELRPGSYAGIDTETRTDFGVDDEGDTAWAAEKRNRKIYAEEIQGVLTKHHPGQTAKDKQAKGDLLEQFFGTRSWTKISESTRSEELREGLRELRRRLEPSASADDELPAWADGGEVSADRAEGR